MPSPQWIEKASIFSLVLWIPSAVSLSSVFFNGHRRGDQDSKFSSPFWTALAVSILYVGAVINIWFSLSVLFMVGWPLLAIALTGTGLAFTRSAPLGERRKLMASNALLLILSLVSIVAPN
jgi:hypothetical protein